MKKYITYIRVSTQKQGISGLGFEAQQDTISKYIKDGEIIGEYKEVESGRNNFRPELMKAIDQVKKDKDNVLVIAKLDRLSRSLGFITTLMDSGISFICCDMPDATPLTLHIFASLAQWERERISDRTREALQAYKKRGGTLGKPENFTIEGRRKGNDSYSLKQSKNENNVKAKAMIKVLREHGKSLKGIAEYLNTNGFKTVRGKEFTPIQVSRLCEVA